jgi:hypothetical protein
VPMMSFALITPEGKGILGNVDYNGVVTFAIDAGPDSSVRGTDLFNMMMDHFGSSALAIHGVWIRGATPGPSTNIDKINELTMSGMPLEKAVHHAWTVTRSKKRGFGRVSILNQPEGSPGNYTRIDVLLERD